MKTDRKSKLNERQICTRKKKSFQIKVGCRFFIERSTNEKSMDEIMK